MSCRRYARPCARAAIHKGSTPAVTSVSKERVDLGDRRPRPALSCAMLVPYASPGRRGAAVGPVHWRWNRVSRPGSRSSAPAAARPLQSLSIYVPEYRVALRGAYVGSWTRRPR